MPHKDEIRTRLLAMLEDIAAQDALGKDSARIVTLDQQSVGRLSRMDALQNQAMAQATEDLLACNTNGADTRRGNGFSPHWRVWMLMITDIARNVVKKFRSRGWNLTPPFRDVSLAPVLSSAGNPTVKHVSPA